MTAGATAKASHPVAAASVLYRPDPDQLDALLRALDIGGRRILLFVNGPIDAGAERIVAALANARIMRSAANIGLGAGLNAVAAAALAEDLTHLVLFDQDSAPEPDLCAALRDRFSRLEGEGAAIAALGPLLVTPPDGNYRPLRYSWRDRAAGTVDFAPTSGSLISLAAWQAIGPFREDYFVGGIDVEWGFRAWRAGYGCFVARDIRMVHRWGVQATGGQRSAPQILRQSDARTYLYLRNAVDCLRLPFIPLRWKGRLALTLLAQIGALLWSRGFSAPSRKLIRGALGDGWSRRLGPLPRDLAIDE